MINIFKKEKNLSNPIIRYLQNMQLVIEKHIYSKNMILYERKEDKSDIHRQERVQKELFFFTISNSILEWVKLHILLEITDNLFYDV